VDKNLHLASFVIALFSMNKRTAWIFVVAIVLISVAGAFFVYPNNKVLPQLDKLRPWRLGLDLVGGTHLIYKIDLSKVADADKAQTASGLRDVIERRVNLFGVSEPQVTVAQSQGDYLLNVDLAGISDVNQAIKEIGLVPYLEFRVQQTVGTSTQYAPTNLTGKYLTSAQLTFNQTTGQPQVALQFNNDGAKIFEDLTAQNVGNIIGIFIDGYPVSLPKVDEKISGGQAVISGNFTLAEAKTMVQSFNAGALPAPMTLINQQTIGASLGKDSLDKSIVAGIIGTILVMLFMMIYYRFFGFLASIALIIYAILSLTVFKLFVTMSLAGIAGFLLSIGMAVDANVLIFERTKEEIKRGLSRTAAIKEGFRRAWPSIRDSNISTIITCLILYYFTSSFVRGLALTLLLGVVVSLFTAITVTRNLMTVTVKDKTDNQ
jgi:protein-export SecD/SecF family membrane protein